MFHFETLSSVLVEDFGCEYDGDYKVILPRFFEESANLVICGDQGQAVIEYMEYSAVLGSIEELANAAPLDVAKVKAAYEAALTDGWETLTD